MRGSIGNNLAWTIHEDLPDHITIYINNVEILSGRWNRTRVILSLDDLDVGVYTFRLVVRDFLGHVSTDTVLVHVSVYVDLSVVSIVSVILIEASLAIIIVVFMRPAPPEPKDPLAELRGEIRHTE
jgi:hypothetical protein